MKVGFQYELCFSSYCLASFRKIHDWLSCTMFAVKKYKWTLLSFHQPVLRSSKASFVRSCLLSKWHWSLIILRHGFVNIICCRLTTPMFVVNQLISIVVIIYSFNAWTKFRPHTAKQRTVYRKWLVLWAMFVIIWRSMADELKMCHVTRQLLIWTWTTQQSTQQTVDNHSHFLVKSHTFQAFARLIRHFCEFLENRV